MSEVSILRRLLRYFQHGFILSLISIALTVFITFAYAGSYFMYIILGPILMYAPMYAVAFAVLGGINLALVQHLWSIELEPSIGNGMRDGAIFYILFNVTFLPVSISIQGFIMWGYLDFFPDTMLILLITSPIYMIVAGAIGERLVRFLYFDSEPEMPPDFSKHSYTCIHCGARYYYGEESRSKGVLTCQNCMQEFEIKSD